MPFVKSKLFQKQPLALKHRGNSAALIPLWDLLPPGVSWVNWRLSRPWWEMPYSATFTKTSVVISLSVMTPDTELLLPERDLESLLEKRRALATLRHRRRCTGASGTSRVSLWGLGA